MPHVKNCLLALCLISLNSWTFAQGLETKSFDILNYQFHVVLNDTTDVVRVDAKIDIQILEASLQQITLDFAKEIKGVGMTVSDLSIDGHKARYSHASDRLKIDLPRNFKVEAPITISVSYSGIPEEGLIISQNKHGERTFFAEHWPNRAHHWLPVVDHPSEKATCEFIVTAPKNYQVVANGELQSVIPDSEDLKKTTWKMDYPISPKVMVIGVAPFVKETLSETNNITAWVYEKSAASAVNDFEMAPVIYDTLISYMKEYPFSKCDQVESSTRFGGMENAGNIFYPEVSLTGEQKINKTIAHEIAHQWFGNAVTEADWTDLWISEGFATFFENYWVEKALGMGDLLVKLEEEEDKVIKYQSQHPCQMIVQQPVANLNLLMNAMTYDKAGWMLRMLRYKLGDAVFRKVVTSFYQKHRYGTASSQDFVEVAKKVSNKDLDKFFEQWLYTPGIPKITYQWEYRKSNLTLLFEQQSDYVYELDFDVRYVCKDGTTETIKVSLDKRKNLVEEVPSCKVTKVEVDPDNIILGKFRKK